MPLRYRTPATSLRVVSIPSLTFPAKTHACLLTPNPVLILKNNILQLLKSEPSCNACKMGLIIMENALPTSLAGLTTAEKNYDAGAVEYIEAELQDLWTAEKISTPQTILLYHESEMVLVALGRG